MSNKSLIYAIDFGTSNSLLAAASRDRVYEPIPLDSYAKDPTVLRSLLFFPSMNQVFYGTQAIEEFSRNQGKGRLIRSIKKHLPIRSFVGTWIDDRPANLEDLIGFFLREMRVRANKHFQADVDSVVLGRPARFSADDSDDKFAQFRLERAARNAGFNHIEFCPEPVAAAFDFKSRLKDSKLVLVGDFGGGTSDFTVVRIHAGEHEANDVLSIGGVALAGDVLDGAIMRNKLSPHFGAKVTYRVPFSSNLLTMPSHLMEKICSPADVSLLGERDVMDFLKRVQSWSLSAPDKVKLDRLFCLIEDQLGFSVFESIEAAKRALSDKPETEISYHYPGVEIDEAMSRKEFEGYINDNVHRIMASLDKTVADAGLKFSDIDIVCCTGGTARVPMLNTEMTKRFGAEKLQQQSPFHSVVQGLAHRAQQLAK